MVNVLLAIHFRIHPQVLPCRQIIYTLCLLCTTNAYTLCSMKNDFSKS
jgi:hypothetical protein